MKKISALVLFALACNLAFAQTDENRKAAFHFSFISPVGTNGLHSAKTTNVASLNLLVGVSKNEQAFTLGGLSNVILNDATGVQIAGLSNYVGNKGAGFQLAGLVNINKGSFSGFQVGGLFNSAGNVNGVQIAGLVNTAKDIQGLQFAGLVNTAADVKGVQIGGLVNIAKDVKGVQFAGLINIAENSDVPIGLINIIKNGEMSIAATYDAIGSTVLSFRSGGKYTYGILGMGYNHKAGGNGLVVEAGLGAHIPVLSWFRINNELKVSAIEASGSKNSIFNYGYSLLPAFRIGRHIELFGGASINYMQFDGTTNNTSIFPKHSLWNKSSSTRLQHVYIGYQVGVQFIF